MHKFPQIIAYIIFIFLSLGFSGCSESSENIKVEQHNVIVQGKNISYTINRTKTNSACELYIHGNSADSSWMAPTIQKRRSEEKCVVTLDLPGHGKSDRYEAYPVTLMTDSIKKVISHSGLADSPYGYYAIGWSLGGDLLIHLSSSLPNLKSLIVAGTPLISLRGNSLPPSVRSNSFATNTVSKNQYHLVADLTDNQKKQLAQSFFCNYDKACDVPEALLQSVINTDNKVRSGIVESFQAGLVKDEFNLLLNKPKQVKTCLLYGKQDALVNPEYMKLAGKKGKFNYRQGVDTPHAMFLHPDVMNTAINNCLNM